MAIIGRPLSYAAGSLNRASLLRRNTDWLEQRLNDPASRVLPVWRTRNLVRRGEMPEPGLLNGPEAAWFVQEGAQIAFLGLLDDIAHFALDLSHIDVPGEDPVVASRGRFMDLRRVGALVDHETGALLAYARGLMYWHHRHAFCGACGAPTQVEECGHLRRCNNPACATEHHPRTDPAVIMLVTDGDRCLLGRQASWPEGRYSTLAGFVEPGETLEKAVAREVLEESGIHVGAVRYHGSQPWPFPSSIMLGFYAEATSNEITIGDDELEDAQWFSRATVAHSYESGSNENGLLMPRGDSIAARLIEDWVKGED